MKKLITLVLSLAFVTTGSVYADKAAGEKLYKAKGCSSCHHPTKDQLASGMGPSYQQVSAAYKKGAGKAGLEKFMKGEGEAIVAPEKASIMKGQLKVTKKLTDAQRGDIADFILSH
jgi:cytochrome c551/c552